MRTSKAAPSNLGLASIVVQNTITKAGRKSYAASFR